MFLQQLEDKSTKLRNKRQINTFILAITTTVTKTQKKKSSVVEYHEIHHQLTFPLTKKNLPTF